MNEAGENFEQQPSNEQNGQGVVVDQFLTIPDIKKRAMLIALAKSLGIVSQAAKKVNISRETHYEWKRTDEQYALCCRLITELSIDFAEGKLFELINGVTVQDFDKKGKRIVYAVPPNPAATIFFLKTKAKHRGYVEKLQLENLTDDDVESTLEF